MDNTEKTTQRHWEEVHAVQPSLKLPSKLSIGTLNLQRILKQYCKPHMTVLEIGCAPGKQLAYVAKILKARVTGIDFSEPGLLFVKRLFNALAIEGDLRCEDIFQTTLRLGSFDVVYSNGVIEHFDDPTSIIRKHVELLKPGGTAIIIIPNYKGIYGKIQHYFDPKDLHIHNLNIMDLNTLRGLAPHDLAADVTVYPAGKLNPWMISWSKKIDATMAKIICYFLNGVGHLLCDNIKPLSPHLVLRVVRA